MQIASQFKKRTLSKKKPCSHDMMTVGVQWIGQSTHAGQEKKRRTKRAQEDLREPSMATRCGTRGAGRSRVSAAGGGGKRGHARLDRGCGRISAAHHSGNTRKGVEMRTQGWAGEGTQPVPPRCTLTGAPHRGVKGARASLHHNLYLTRGKNENQVLTGPRSSAPNTSCVP